LGVRARSNCGEVTETVVLTAGRQLVGTTHCNALPLGANIRPASSDLKHQPAVLWAKQDYVHAPESFQYILVLDYQHLSGGSVSEFGNAAKPPPEHMSGLVPTISPLRIAHATRQLHSGIQGRPAHRINRACRTCGSL
jgi:hypothetical protein